MKPFPADHDLVNHARLTIETMGKSFERRDYCNINEWERKIFLSAYIALREPITPEHRRALPHDLKELYDS